MRANRWWIAAAAALALAVLVQSSAALRGLARRKGNRAVDLAVRGARRLVPRAWKLGHGLRDGAVMTGEVVSWDGEDRIKRVSRVPVAWRAAALGDDLLEYLRAAVPMFAYEAHELTLERGFNACTDNPDLPGHRYYEGYFHGLAGTARPVRSMNPRDLGHVLKPAAPRALRALVECVRRELAPPLAAALARALAAWCSAASPAPSGGAVASSGSSAGAAGTLWPWSTWHERHALSAHLERRERSGEG